MSKKRNRILKVAAIASLADFVSEVDIEKICPENGECTETQYVDVNGMCYDITVKPDIYQSSIDHAFFDAFYEGKLSTYKAF